MKWSKNLTSLEIAKKVLNEGILENHLCFGIKGNDLNLISDKRNKDNNPNLQTLLHGEPGNGALFCGGMGKGKSVALQSVLLLHMLSNKDAKYVLLDPAKGLSDYNAFLKIKNLKIYKNGIDLDKAINDLYEEYEKRMLSPNINHPMQIIAIEELYYLIMLDSINYPTEKNAFGTVANKFRTILENGYYVNFIFLGASSKITENFWDPATSRAFSNHFTFRSDSANITGMNVNIEKHKEINDTSREILPYPCLDQHDNLLSFLYFSDEEILNLLSEYKLI